MKHIHSIIKVAVVTILATVIAYLLGITNYLSAGILAMISIQQTKSLSLLIAFKRTVSVFAAMIIATLLFLLIGYNLGTYAVILIIVVAASFSLNINEGMIPSVVIVTHLLVLGEFSVLFFFETTLLVVVSIGIALLFNFFYPSESALKLEEYRNELDLTVQKQLIYLKEKIETQTRTCDFTNSLEKDIELLLKKIEQVTGDLFMKNHQDILEYTLMRTKQFDILKSICTESNKLLKIFPQTEIVVKYLDDLSNDIGLGNRASYHLNQIDILLSGFQDDTLPKTREEFEHRAILYHIILEIKQFLNLKIQYHNKKSPLH